VLGALIVVSVASAAVSSQLHPALPLARLLLTSAASLGVYVAALLVSIGVYRLIPALHPLGEYPGPLLARLSQFYSYAYTLDGGPSALSQA
jgi:hypothetical protein